MYLNANKTYVKLAAFISVWLLVIVYMIVTYQNGRLYYERQYELEMGKGQHSLMAEVLKEIQENEALYEPPQKQTKPSERLLQRATGTATNCGLNFASLPRRMPTIEGEHSWQSYEHQNISFKLFAAYYDRRESIVTTAPIVRILAMVNQIESSYAHNYCQLSFADGPTINVEINQYLPIWLKSWFYNTASNLLYPHLISCTIPAELKHRIPQTVSLVATKCVKNVSNVMEIHNEAPSNIINNEKPINFAICTKGLNYTNEDISIRLVEWLELMRQLGAEKVYTYNLDETQANVSKVLQYYVEQEFVVLQPLSLMPPTGDNPALHKRLNEILPYNDCFYRHMYKHAYIAAVDLDEIIMPLGTLTNWSQLIEVALQNASASQNCHEHGYASICFKNVYFPTDVEPRGALQTDSNYFFLKHVQRVATYTNKDWATKCLHNTSEALTLHNHYSLHWSRSCRPLTLDEHYGQLQHYRELTTSQEQSELVADYSIMRLRDILIENVEQVLKTLHLIVA